MARKRWLLPIFLSVVIGVASVATLVIRAHPAALGCPGASFGSVIDCRAVVTSADGVLLGLPLGLWGLVWLVGWWVTRIAFPRSSVTVLWAAGGVMGVAYAVGTEVRIGHLCAWCTLNQAAIMALGVFFSGLGRRRGMG